MLFIYESKNHYDEEYWELIRKGVLDLNKRDRLQTGVPFPSNSTELGKYTRPTQLQESSSKPAENTSDVCTEASKDDETIINSIAHKKLSGKLSNDDMNYLKNYKGDGSPKSDLFLLSSKLLQKDELSVHEDAILELSLSGIYNYLNPVFVKMYDKEIKRRSPLPINALTQGSEAPDDAIMRLFGIISGTDDTEDVLNHLQTEKSKLTKNKARNTDTYVMLSIMEKQLKILNFGKTAVKSKRVNACIINELQAKSSDFHSILALDVTGLNGYVYQLTKFDDYFIALPFLQIVIPRTFADVENSKDLLSTLFCLRSFYKSVVKNLVDIQVKETKIRPRSMYSVNPIVSRSKKEEIKSNTDVESLLAMILIVVTLVLLLSLFK